MKKLVLPLMASMALLLSACGSNMEDKERKSEAYYKEHTDEAKEKFQWCLEKTNTTLEQFKALHYTERTDLAQTAIDEGKLDVINGANCFQVFVFITRNVYTY